MASIGEEEEIKKKTEDKTGEGYGVGKLYETHVIAVTTFQREMSAVRAVVEAEEIKCARGKDAKIFDTDLYNFHLYPEDEEIAKQIKHDIQGKRFDVIKAFAENGKQWKVELLPTTDNFDKILKAILGKADSDRDSKIYVSGDSKNKTCGYGGQGNIVGETSSNSKIFYFVRAMKNGVIYELNFDGEEKDKKVNCILKEIQFDRCVEDYVNKYKGNCDICYPPTSESQSEEDLKNILEERKGKSFCYNPALSFYDTPQRIAEAFIAFINECERWSKTNG